MSTTYHEPTIELPADVRDVHRAIASLCEELEAVDWYHQRVAVASDDQLRAILAHNRDEEVEHAAMTIEWLRRKLPKFDEELRTYLFSEAPITEIEGHEEGGAHAAGTPSGDLGIGKLERK